MKRKPIIVFYFSDYLDPDQNNEISQKIKDKFGDEYHHIILSGCGYTKVELLTKGRKTATITKKLQNILK